MRKIYAVSMLVGLSFLASQAEEYVWTPTTAINDLYYWSTPANWIPNAPEEGFASDSVLSIGGAPQFMTLDKKYSVTQVKIDNANTTINLGGQHLEFPTSQTNPILIDGQTEGPLNIVISNGTITANASQTFFPNAKNSSSTILLDNVCFTNTSSSGTKIANSSTCIVRDSSFVVSNKDGNAHWYLSSNSTLIFEGPKTKAKMHTKAGRFKFEDDSTLIVSNKADASVINGYVEFPGERATMIIDNAKWTHEVTGFNINSDCKMIVKNNGTFTFPRLNLHYLNPGSHNCTNTLFEVSTGGLMEFKNYPFTSNGINGYGGNKFTVDGEGSILKFNISRDSKTISFNSSNNVIRATNKGTLSFEGTDAGRTLTLSSMNNIIEVDNSTMTSQYSIIGIGVNGTNNVFSLANASTLTLLNDSSLVIGKGNYSKNNCLRITGEGNQVSLSTTSDFCTSNSSAIAFIMTGNMTNEKPMLEFKSTSTGMIILDGITSASFDDTLLRESGEYSTVTLLKIPTAKFTHNDLTSVLKTAAGNHGKVTYSTDETYTYWTYKCTTPGLTVILK